MPTYEFRCPKGHEFEKFYRSISGAPSEVVCPTCGKKSERLMSAGGGLVFKGSGFYITDYGKDGKKPQTAPAAKAGEGAPAGSSSGESASGGGESPSVKGESKPGAETKPSGDTKSGGDSKSSGDSKSVTAPKPAAASKSASKGSSRRAKSSE